MGSCSWEQSTCVLKKGGFVFRALQEVAIPAFIGSRAASRPEFGVDLRQLAAGGLVCSDQLAVAYHCLTLAQDCSHQVAATQERDTEISYANRVATLSAYRSMGHVSGGAPP